MKLAIIFLFAASSFALQEHPAQQSSRDVKIPKVLVTTIEKDYKKFQASMKLASDTPIVRELLSAHVELTQKRPAALMEDVRIVTPIGGGVIDLQDFVTPLKGAFRTRIRFVHNKGHDLKNVKVYYISGAESRQLDGQRFGAGCGKYFDITSYFVSKLSQRGVEVFTADQRYLSVLAGTIVLVSFAEEALYVGSVTITDSRFSALQCESEV